MSSFKREKIDGGLEAVQKRIRKPGTVDIGIIDAGKHPSGDITIAHIGFVHEFGGVIKHPGGTPYKIMANGQARFVPLGTKGIAGTTQPHDITIPERSFLRATMVEQKKEIISFQKSVLPKIISGDMTTEKALGLLGELVSGMIKQKIVKGPFQELAASTKRAKAPKTKPLIDTGQLKNSITYSVNE